MISIIIPVYNEEGNIEKLYDELLVSINKTNYKNNYEIIIVDDNSVDNTNKLIKKILKKNKRLKLIKLLYNQGQTAALSAGNDHAKGKYIITMDGDLQNDPADIPMLLNRINEGYDCVLGYRKDRKDNFFSRKILSWLGNKLISFVSKIQIIDSGCSLRIYKRDEFKKIKMYGEMHRLLPLYFKLNSKKIIQEPVNHRERKFGKSKYGIERTLKLILDLLFVYFTNKFLSKPIYVFGSFGIFSFLISIFSFIISIILKIFYKISFVETPLLLLTVTTFLIGTILLLMGVLAEIIIRIYYESLDKKIYHIEEKSNF